MALVRLWTKYRDSRFDDCYRDFHCAELFDTKVPEAEPYHGKWAYPWQSEVEDATISTIALNDSDEFHIIIHAEFDEDTEEGRIIGFCWIAFPQNQSSYMIAYIARSLDYRGVRDRLFIVGACTGIRQSECNAKRNPSSDPDPD